MKVPKDSPRFGVQINGKSWGEMTEEEHQRFPGDFESTRRKSLDVPLETPSEPEPSVCQSCCDAGETKRMMVVSCDRDDSLAIRLDAASVLK